jgi:hypothetical protein
VVQYSNAEILFKLQCLHGWIRSGNDEQDLWNSQLSIRNYLAKIHYLIHISKLSVYCLCIPIPVQQAQQNSYEDTCTCGYNKGYFCWVVLRGILNSKLETMLRLEIRSEVLTYSWLECLWPNNISNTKCCCDNCPACDLFQVSSALKSIKSFANLIGIVRIICSYYCENEREGDDSLYLIVSKLKFRRSLDSYLTVLTR